LDFGGIIASALMLAMFVVSAARDAHQLQSQEHVSSDSTEVRKR